MWWYNNKYLYNIIIICNKNTLKPIKVEDGNSTFWIIALQNYGNYSIIIYKTE